MAMILIGRVLNQLTDSAKTFEQHLLVPEEHDFVGLSYTGSNLTTIIYKQGGAGGTTVATLTLAYTGSRLDTVTRT